MQKVLLLETEKRNIGAKAVSYENINFDRDASCCFPDSPRQALARGWHLIQLPFLQVNKEGLYEWWFAKSV